MTTLLHIAMAVIVLLVLWADARHTTRHPSFAGALPAGKTTASSLRGEPPAGGPPVRARPGRSPRARAPSYSGAGHER
jgi:hypothetical protein